MKHNIQENDNAVSAANASSSQNNFEQKHSTDADPVIQLVPNSFHHNSIRIQRQEGPETPGEDDDDEAEKDSKIQQQPAEPDHLTLKTPFLERNVPHLWDPNAALGVWKYNYQFFKGLGIGDNFAGKAANLTAPFSIDSQLKAENPKWWEITDKELGTSSFVGSVPAFSFDSNFRNWKILPFLRKKPLEKSAGIPNDAFNATKNFLQRKCAHCEEETNLQLKPLFSMVQKKQASHKVAHSIESSKGGGTPIPEPTRDFMESRFGTDFSAVRIHDDHIASDLSSALSAQAFTVGNDIYFNKGKYAPETTAGKQLLAHELTHTVQQGSQKMPATSSPVAQRSIWSSIKNAAGAVWGGIKTVGRGIAAGAEWIWDTTKWLGKQLIDKVAGVFQRFAYWMTQLPTRVVRLLSGLWEGLKTFKPWTHRWWKSLVEVDTWKHFLKWITSRILEILEIGGIGEAYETLQDWVKFNTRTLNSSEVKAAKSVFGTRINTDFVRVDERAVIGPLFTDRAYTSFHTINSWGGESIDVMIHELTHVWQYENSGAIYMPQAVHAQKWGGGYQYGGVSGLQAKQATGKGLLSFNREQQAQIIQDFFQLRQNGTISGSPATSADLPLYADFAKTVSSLSLTNLTTPV
jgi:hypothetical protein